MTYFSTQKWDDAFFQRFLGLHSQIYDSYPDFVPESLKDFELFFADDSAFSNTMHWKAALLVDEGTNQPVARYLMSLHPESESLSFGFFEVFSNQVLLELKNFVFNDFAEFQRRFPKLNKVQGPIQGSIFQGFRFREPTDTPRFLGESLHQEFYPIAWQEWGFKIEEHWESYNLPIQSGISFFESAGQRLQKFWQDPKIRCRGLNQKAWDQEVAAIFKITSEAYNLNGTNNEIDLRIFANLSAKIRPLVSGKTVKLLEYADEVVGFTICYIDIQEEIRRYNRRRKDSWPSLLNKLFLIGEIKLRRHPLLLMYIAKSPKAPVKWAMTKLGCEALKDIAPEQYSSVISAFNADTSGSHSSLPPDKILISKHFLMSLPLRKEQS